MKELYERLGVSQNATSQEIRSAYKNRSRQLHPDKGGNKEDMQRLNEAYTLLTDPEALKKWENDHPEGNDLSGFDFLASHGERSSERYRRTFEAMSSFFETHPLEKINLDDKTQAFQDLNKPLMTGLLAHPQYQNLYRVKEDGLVYENIYEYIAHKTKWSDAAQPFAPAFLTEPLTLTKGFNILSRFLAGEFYGKNLEDLIQYIQKQAIILKDRTYDAQFYEALLKIMSVRDITKDYQQITKALDEINCFIYQRHLMEKPEVIALMQNKYYRFFVATVLKQDWQSNALESPKAMLLCMKSELNYLRRLVPMSGIHLTFETKVQTLLSEEASAAELIDMGYLLIDLMVTSITSFSRINTGIMAALCFHQAASLETNEAKIMALEFISLCLYQGAIARGFNTNVLLAFYTSNQVIKCLNLLHYDQSTLNIEILETYLTQPGDSALLNFSGSVVSSIRGTIKRALYLVDIVPFYVLPKSVLDGELIEIFQMGMLRASLDNLLAKKKDLQDFDYAKVVYHAYEIALTQWCIEERNNQSQQKVVDLKMQAIEALLKAEQSHSNQMAEMIDKPFISMKRAESGWFNPDHSLDFSEDLGLKIYSDFHGLEFDKKTLEFRLITEEWTENKPVREKLFTEFDIRQMLYFGIRGGFLSLDHHDSDKLHDPIQKVRFEPQQIAGTEYLKTLFMTDYLLKIFTTGAEISGQPPYLVRSSDELLANLPEHLQKVLKICSEDTSNSGHCHRFWITAGPMNKEISTEEECEKTFYTDPEMNVQKQLLRIDTNGELKDAPVDSADESKEAIFAREFTKHYDEIGQHFPEFLRLKKLVKISAAILELSRIRDKNLAKLEPSKQLLADNQFWLNHSAKELIKSTATLRQGYERLSPDFRTLLQGLRPISDTNWWDNSKYQTIYNEKCAILSKVVRDLPKFSFSLQDSEVVKTYNELYSENYTRIYNENYQANKNAIIQSHGQQAWNTNEQKISSDLRTNITQNLAANLTQQSVLNMMNQGRVQVKEQIRASYHSVFIHLKNSIGEPAYSNLINQFIAGNYSALAAVLAKEELNRLKETYNQAKADHYKELVFLEPSIGAAALSTHIEQLLLGNIMPLATALAQHKTDGIKTELRNQLQNQEKLEAKFLQMHFEEGAKETKAQKYFVPAVYYSTDNRRVYGGVFAFPAFNKVSQLSRDLQSSFKSCKETAIRNAEDFVRKAGLALGGCLFASSAYANSYSEIRSLEQDIRKAQSDVFWMELNEQNERNRFYSNTHQQQFRYTVESLNPQNASFFHTNPFAVYRLNDELQRSKQNLTTYSQQPELQPYFFAQRIFSNLYNAMESYATGAPSSHVDAAGRGFTHAFLDIASLIAHPLDNFLYPISALVYDATVITARRNILYSKDPDIMFLREQLIADPTPYNEALKRMQLRGDGILDFYRNAEAEEYTKEITRILAPGYLLKAAKTLGALHTNLKNFKQLNVPLYASKERLPDIDIKALSKEEIRRHAQNPHYVDEAFNAPFMYVIDQQGNIIITESIYEYGHVQLGKHKPVAAAGDIYVNKEGNIYRIDNRSGGYLPNHSNLSSLVVKKFQEAGFSEVFESTYVDFCAELKNAGEPYHKIYETRKLVNQPNILPSFYGVFFGGANTVTTKEREAKATEDQSRVNRP